jgi:hypothetical protein
VLDRFCAKRVEDIRGVARFALTKFLCRRDRAAQACQSARSDQEETAMNRDRYYRFGRRVVVAAGLAAAFGLGSPAHAEDWKLVGQAGFLGVGKTYEIEKGHFYWVGEYAGTFFNDKGENSLFNRAGVKCPAWADSDLNTKKAKFGGYCTLIDLDGDQAYIRWQAAGATGLGSPAPGTFEWTGGTGKYKEIKGDNTFVGHTQVNWSDGTATGYATWNR